VTNPNTKITPNPATQPYPNYLLRLKEREDELRGFGVYADHRIWPLTPATRNIFEAGQPVGLYIGKPGRCPADRIFALNELCTCLRHGLIAVSPHPPGCPKA